MKYIHYYNMFRIFLPMLIMGVAVISVFAGCKRRISPTYITVVDSVRHYYPIVSGEKLTMTYMVHNDGEDPFLIDDIQPSCGCVTGPIKVDAIPPHDSLMLSFTFDSRKNIGYVRHCIRLFGNILPRGMGVLVFDVNVVPPSFDQPDYEETYVQRKENGLEELVDGKSSEKGYYTDPNASHDSRQHVKYPWRE